MHRDGWICGYCGQKAPNRPALKRRLKQLYSKQTYHLRQSRFCQRYKFWRQPFARHTEHLRESANRPWRRRHYKGRHGKRTHRRNCRKRGLPGDGERTHPPDAPDSQTGGYLLEHTFQDCRRKAVTTALHTFEPRYRLDAHKKPCWSDWYPARHRAVRPAIGFDPR